MNELVQISTIATAVITLIGVIVSMWLSVKALREVQRDRQLNHRPFILMQYGAHRVSVEFVKAGKAIPGINPGYVHQILSHLPNDIESVRMKRISKGDKQTFGSYGKILNYGNGPAIDVNITFIPKKLVIGTDEFDVNDKKLQEPLYQKSLNSLPVSPSHVTKDIIGELHRIPSFIEKDVDKKISKVEGILEIEYFDIFSNKFTTCQEFRIFTNYQENPYVQFVFSDLIKDKTTANIV